MGQIGTYSYLFSASAHNANASAMSASPCAGAIAT